MAPRHQTLPPAQTSSAREALQSFYCSLCSKGYSRMNDYEAHLSSYDHSHKQRLKDMKAMVRDPTAGARARKAEAKAGGLVPIKLVAKEQPQQPQGTGSFKKGGFKKGGFKSAFASAEAPADADSSKSKLGQVREADRHGVSLDRNAQAESDTEDEGYQVTFPLSLMRCLQLFITHVSLFPSPPIEQRHWL
ncbi:G patch domain-containing protein 8 [Colletotrichum orbiculare MAFF 240422]|uniref:G patch domain-containing protein 8 n=1 Tax=Colletotrichum orbiculare (strain 104-T / ATCC 96160 / CBS 514.97 / LARS 414 / MAFF 240422) TaxID=1213857 RepID=A0A484FC48_COLOR|nr:G patch domain-containing protein 8 [Colletotrichum orbiculare MAFF 240422]